ncbi:MAG: radical SAM protein [Ignisphaera sp.]
MPELVINVSNIISSLCYTILKLEPYTICPFRCVYCYSRWYMKSPSRYVYPRPKALGMFREVILKIYRRSLKPIPFRLSTLVDPFPPHEQLYRVSENILRVALEYHYPLVINTKSIYFLHQPLKSYVEKLLDDRLAILQISISTLNDDIAQVIEPRAPEVKKRLDTIKQLGSTDIPLVLRISPYIPYASPTQSRDIEHLVYLARDLGFKHIIVEALRMETNNIRNLLEYLNITKIDIDSYSLRKVEGLKPLVRISLHLLEKTYTMLSNELKKHGITFATCKEGLFDLHTASDCCGLYLLREYIVRATLQDVYRYVTEMNINSHQELQNIEVVENLCKKYSRLCLDELHLYPKNISKTLRYHEKKMFKVLQNIDLLKHIAPHLAKEFIAT